MIDSQALLDRINKVDRGECDEALSAELDHWASYIGELESIRAVSETDAIKRIIRNREEQIKEIDAKLLGVRQMTELERLNLLDRRDLFREFINSFDVDNRLAVLAKEVEENLC